MAEILSTARYTTPEMPRPSYGWKIGYFFEDFVLVGYAAEGIGYELAFVDASDIVPDLHTMYVWKGYFTYILKIKTRNIR